jgi:hypothetical protein
MTYFAQSRALPQPVLVDDNEGHEDVEMIDTSVAGAAADDDVEH